LSAIESPEHGYFGGYLIVSSLGRPLEFHCTAPVRPSRAQEILYGPTLRSYLVGEQIGRALVGAAKLKPRLILTDQADVIGTSLPDGVPLVLVLTAVQPSRDDTLAASRFDGAASSPQWKAAKVSRQVPCFPFTACNHELLLPRWFDSDRETVLAMLALLAERVNLSEPFGRIHTAIREAQRIGGQGAEAHGQAA